MQQIVNLNTIILLFTFAVNIGLSFFIFSRDKHSRVHGYFSALLFCIALWTLAFIFFQSNKSLELTLFLRRLAPVGAALIAGYFLLFTIVFPKQEQAPFAWWVNLLLLLPGFIFSFLSVFSGWMIKAVVVVDPEVLFLSPVIYGPLYLLYVFYFVVYFSTGLGILLFKYFLSHDREKLQIFYVLFGAMISGVIGVVFSMFLPLFGIQTFFTAGPPFTLVFVLFVTYAIVRLKLLDIDDFLSWGVLVVAGTILLVGTLALLIERNLSSLLPFYTILANLGLGTFVYLRDRKNVMHRIFFVLTGALAIWSFLIYMAGMTNSYADVLWWHRSIYALAVLISFLAWYFSVYFPYHGEKKTGLFVNFILAGISFCFAALALFSGLVIKSVYFNLSSPIVIWGPIFPFLLLYVVFFLSVAFINALQKYVRSHGLQRLQMRYVFFGVFLVITLVIIVNVVLPLIGNSQFTSLGPSFMVILVALAAYAMVRQRLLSVEIIAQKGAVFAASILLVVFAYILTLNFSETYLRNEIGYSFVIFNVFVVVFLTLTYRPLVDLLQIMSDRIFFQERYDYQKALKDISQKIASVIRLEELARLVVSSFVDTIKVSEISFLLLDKNKEHFQSVSISLPRYKKIEIDVASPLVSWLIAAKDLLIKEEVEEEIARQGLLGKEGQVRQANLQEVRDEMERLEISVWVPIISKQELIGIIALGHKLSGDLFNAEDIGLLSTLANQTAVALDNARLYDEVVNIKDYNEEILQSMVSGVITVDMRKMVITYNFMAEKICGKKPSEILGKSCVEIWGARGTVTQIVEQTLSGRGYINFEASLASPQRGIVPVSFSSTLLRDHQGKKIGALIAMQDLSDIKELEEKVRRADKLTALATMAAGMAHEIKNPLSSMKVLAQLLPLKFEDMEYRQKLQEILPREINRIDRIVESLLGFARATAPKFEKEDINKILEENVKYFREQAKQTSIEIMTSYAVLPEIEVDRGQIAQVFSNLILNAIQAMSNGGTIQIITAPGKMVDNLLENVKITVKDSGYGIAEEMLNKLFDPFFTTKYGGTGLGLTITHSIVDGHKGYIDVQSEIGKGTTFTVTLPVKQVMVQS